jgi:hypothetical protein
LGTDFYESIVSFIAFFVFPVIVLIRFRKVFYALYLDSRDSGGLFGFVVAPIKWYIRVRRSHIRSRTEWAEAIIEQENNRNSHK